LIIFWVILNLPDRVIQAGLPKGGFEMNNAKAIWRISLRVLHSQGFT
jgi:hypothetical protein